MGRKWPFSGQGPRLAGIPPMWRPLLLSGGGARAEASGYNLPRLGQKRRAESKGPMIVRARTVNAILEQGGVARPVQNSELRPGDGVVEEPEHSVYCISGLGDSTYSVWGG